MKKVLAFILFIGMAGQANAAVYSDASPGSFSYGVYTNGDAIMWDTTFPPAGNNDGYIATSLGGDSDAAVGDVQIVGSDTGLFATHVSSAMTTVIQESGEISVDWDYFTLDPPAGFDPFVWLLNGVVQDITNFDLFSNNQQVGTFMTSVNVGDIFGFAILTDNLLAEPFPGANSADVGLSGIQFGDLSGNMLATPVPPAFLLFGTALAGLGIFRRKKAAA